jgi:peroxiredoxin
MMDKNKLTKAVALVSGLALGLAVLSVPGRAQDLKPVTVWQSMPDFTLPSIQGGEVTLSKLRGKTILLIFLRGLASENHWCHICNYQYADLTAIEQAKQVRKANNVEILFVLPYGKDLAQQWVDTFAAQLQDIENWKNPPDPAKLDEAGKTRMQRYRALFPKKYLYEKGNVPLPFPVLYDADQKITKGLGIFTMEWGGSKVAQDVPMVIVIDAKGIVQLKYISQNTFDRPSTEYLINFIAKLGK